MPILVKGADLIFDVASVNQAQGNEPISLGNRDPAIGFQLVNHFVQAIPNGATSEFLIQSLSGAGAAATISAGTSRRGVAVFTTGTTAAGRAGVITSFTPLLIPDGNAVYRAKIRFRIPVLSASGEQFTFYFGFGDNTGASNDGAWMQVDSFFNPAFRLMTANGGVTSSFFGTVDGVADTDYVVEIVLTATSATMLVNGVVAGALSTNLPAGSAAFGVICSINKSSGTTPRTAEVDFISLDVRDN